MKFPTFVPLETERLSLRRLCKQDRQEVLFLRSDPDVNHYVQRPAPKDLRAAQAFIEQIDNGIEHQKIYYWAISQKSSSRMIGSICLWKLSPEQSSAEVGYDLHPDYHRQGIMGEALVRVLRFGFEELGVESIEAYTHRENRASISLLEKHHFVHIKGKVDENNAHNFIFSLRPPMD